LYYRKTQISKTKCQLASGETGISRPDPMLLQKEILMIKEISVNGFKSLINFTLKLNPGLNILVGPNGSGKTNIICFFEFLGDLQELSVSNAISTAGGAGTVLTKIGEGAYSDDLSATISGSVRLSAKRYVYYNYSFEISMFKIADRITYKRQSLKVKFRTVDTQPETRVDNYDYDFERVTDNDLRVTSNVHKFNRKRVTGQYLFGNKKESFSTDRLKEIINNYTDNDHSIVPVLRHLFEDSYLIMNDLRGGPVFNIEPSKARIPEDSAKSPGIRKDGSGLYATLYALKQNETTRRIRIQRYFGYRYRDEYREIGNTKLSEIIKYVRLANTSIKSIDVINNPFDNQLQVRVSVSGEEKDTILPLAAMSDGTIKWIALLTILSTSRTVFSIEEPENYLHPLMQSEILSVMRAKTKTDRSILMSTHSETLLNSAEPQEIIVVSFQEGKTKAHRPANTNEILDEIKRTGFGLGYYYLAGSIDDE
jgi:predicted ATPase